MQSKSSDKASDPLIGRLEAIVLEHMANEDFDVETFSNLSGLSRTNLYRKIKKHTGKSVTEFVRDIRLRKSLEYLRDGDRTASEVAYLVGFSSATYFNKCFKDRYGFTPGDANYYRERNDEILQTQSEETGKKNRKTSFFKPILLIALVIGVALFGWYFISGYTADTSTNPSIDPAIDLNSDKNKEPGLSVAVLLMRNLTGEDKYDHRCFGITYELIDRLSDYDGVSRVSRMSSILSIKDSLNTLSVKDIAEKLQVEHVLDGYILKSENQYRIGLELLDANNNNILWKEEIPFTWDAENAPLLEKSIANKVINSLGFETNSYTDLQNAHTTSELAHDYFYKGLYQVKKFTRQGWENGKELLEKAIEEDPQFINAYSELADLWLYGGMNWAYATQEEAWTNAKLYYFKVMELDPGNENALNELRIGYFYYGLNAADSIPELKGFDLEKWMEIHNDFAEKTGRHKIAMQGNYNWLKRDPANGSTYALLALNNYFLNQPETALELLDEHYPLYKDHLNFLREAAKTYYFLGAYNKMEEAVLHFFDSFSNERPSIIRWLRAIVADKNNNQAMVEEQIGHLLEDYRNGKSGSPAWFLALYHAYKGEKEKTLDWLEKSYEAREVEMTWLAQEPDLELVGDEPRYRALLDSMNFSESARRHVVFKD